MKKITEQLIQLLNDNKREEALKLLFDAIESDSNNEVHYINAGNLLFEERMYEEAERFFLKAIELNEKAATAYFSLGNLYYNSEQFERAEQLLRKAIDLGLEEADVYYLLGMTFVKRQLHLFGIPYLQRAQELGSDITISFQYGLALAKVNYLDEAEKIFKQVLKQDENYVDALYNLGILYIHQDQFDEGKLYLQKALQVNPNHLLAKKALEQFTK